MTSMNWKSLLAVVAAGTLAISGCSGADGKDGINGVDGQDGQDGQNGATGPQGPVGPTGPQGPVGPTGPTGPAGQDLVETAKAESCEVCHANAGSAHQGRYNPYKDSKLALTIDSVTSTLNADSTTYTTVVAFTVKYNGAATDQYGAALAGLAAKSFYAVKYDGTAGTFDYDTAWPVGFGSFGAIARTGVGQYTITGSALKFAPESSDAVVFGVVGAGKLPLSYTGRVSMYDDAASTGVTYGAATTYASAANVDGCVKCHGAPYQKHGYIAGKAAGLGDFVSCKVCHTDNRTGSHLDWQVLVDDPARYVTLAATPLTAAEQAKYAYKATLMNDTHQSHAMEFGYPQSMANCNTCHEGKLTQILADANFTPTTCKSCHPVTGTGGTEAKRAPALTAVIAPYAAFHAGLDLYTAADNACSGCHKAGGVGKDFSEIHPGYNKLASSDGTAKYADTVKMKIDTATFDSATNKLTVNFSVSGTAANAIVKPTVVMSLYGYDSKDFVVGGHASQPAPDGKRNLEWAEGASGNSPRLTVVPGATAGTTWVATADLSLWAAKLADGSVKRMEIGVLPAVGLDQTKAPNNSATTGTPPAPNPAYNPYIAATGDARTFDLVTKALVADAASYGKAIVAVSKCNACHENLGMTFHNPAYGSAGVVGCRLCHVVSSGGSHLEMQSRSIDSYVHSIHAMQAFDVNSIDWTDPVAKLHYEHKIESRYPNFTLLNCESCHNPGTYDVPNQAKSMPGILSASATLKAGWDRQIGVVPSYVTGPGSRACGACHRAEMINEDDPSLLVAFNEHAHSNGTLLVSTTGVWDAAVAKIMALFK